LQIDLEHLRQHYGSLSNDELLSLDRDELTEAARNCYDEELARRDLAEPEEPEAETEQYTGVGSDHDVDADWLQDAACACSFVSQPGGSAATDAENARSALDDARIPCEVSVVEIASSSRDQPAQHEYRVMVPGALNLKATAILDKEVFNPQLEADWRTHFETLTDEELAALTPDVICVGLVDRVARLKHAYSDELARRASRSSA
jgi:hypothetical protein